MNGKVDKMPTKVKVLNFDDGMTTSKEVKSKTVNGLETIMVVESSPLLRQSRGEKTDWESPPGNNTMGLKIIHHDKALPRRTVKQVEVAGLPTLDVQEAASAVAERRSRS
jgi:hypothetical protein